MNVYRLIFDADVELVEAESFRSAIDIWRGIKKIEWGEDYQPDDEPESCERIHDKLVLRSSSLSDCLQSEALAVDGDGDGRDSRTIHGEFEA